MDNELLDKRWRKTNLVSWFLQIAPFIRFIGVSGSMSFGIAKKCSDIDLFIIAKNKRIFTCYFFVKLLLYVTGQLHDWNKPKDGKICPNRFVSDKYLVINPQNKYLAGQYNQIIPIFDYKDYYDRFFTANIWIQDFGFVRPVSAKNLVQSNIPTIIRNIFEVIFAGSLGDRFEKFIYNRELKNIAKNHQNLNKQDSTVVVNHNEIRIHPYNEK
jgi:hypothetical protein